MKRIKFSDIAKQHPHQQLVESVKKELVKTTNSKNLKALLENLAQWN